MGRARNLKPGFFKNEDLAECSLAARLCFAGLPTLADREGRMEDRPKRIKGELFPYDSIEVEPLLVELTTFRFIVRYEVTGQRLIWIPKFRKHQNPHHREAPSTLPPHPDDAGGPSQGSDEPDASPGLAPNAIDTEPWAASGSHAVTAPGQPEARPRLLPDESTLQGGQAGGCEGGPAVLNPSSLNPSSLNPEKESRAKRSARAPKTALPAEFGVSDPVRKWAKGKGFDRLDDHLESFVSKARANGYAYADWDAAFMGAIRDDWAGLRGSARSVAGGQHRGVPPAADVFDGVH